MNDRRPPVHRLLSFWISLGALVVAVVGCGGGSSDVGDGFALPTSHEVAFLVNEADGLDHFREIASEAGLSPFCGRSGWQICMVQVDDILVVVPFSNPAGTHVRISGPGLEREMVLLAEGNEPYGVTSAGGKVEVAIEDASGHQIGGMEGQLTGS